MLGLSFPGLWQKTRGPDPPPTQWARPGVWEMDRGPSPDGRWGGQREAELLAESEARWGTSVRRPELGAVVPAGASQPAPGCVRALPASRRLAASVGQVSPAWF